jgi:MIP family channel proteins
VFVEPKALNKCAAEFIGTFALIFIGAGSILVSILHGVDQPLVGIALAHGLTIAVMVSATGHISGGHLNPAVTFGAMCGRKISPALGLMYMIAQLAGAVAAAYILKEAFAPGIVQAVKLGTPGPGHGFTAMAVFKLEIILTFFLVFVVFGTGIDPKGPKIGGLAIGGTVALDILMGGPLSGASMNPARTFGPALIGNFWDAHWAYWAGPMIGGGLAGLVYTQFVGKGAE